ncbi:nitroreductase [Fodinicurvata sp. EGI_FJ10296]|uniref:nitroreductase family protein n=1 Tax=Fodinicurvata sp. EGI_FJ10296 TaxID=3231908 RepID=UPI0034527DDF
MPENEAVLSFLEARRSVMVRDMVEPGPDAASLDRILKVATRVPDHGKLTPWRIKILHRAGQEALGARLGEIFKRDYPAANENKIAVEAERMTRAPLVLAVVSTPDVNHPKIPVQEQLLSAGLVCYNILCAALAMGYAAQWITEWPAYSPDVVAHLGHNPETDRIVGFVYLGTAREQPTERPRPAVEDVARVWEG